MNQLSFLDQVLKLSENSRRSLDCVFAIELSKVPSLEELKAGIKRAQEIYPKTMAHEIPLTEENDLEAFANRPLKSEWHLEEALIGNTLALKMSHILGDGISMMLFLEAQLTGKKKSGELSLHNFPAKKDTPYRYKTISQAWSPLSDKSSERGFVFFKLNHPMDFGDFSINDVLSLAILKSLPLEKKSLWIPVNVRLKPFEGFGNGLSRMRIYPASEALPVRDQLLFLRKQKREAWKNGEIFLPQKDLALNPFTKLVLKIWLARPWADWGSLSFSHLVDSGSFHHLISVTGITNVPKHLSAAIFAFTSAQETYVTLTYDKNLRREEVEKLGSEILQHFYTVAGVI